MKIISDVLSLEELKGMAKSYFGGLVKAVVDVERRLLAVDADMHADLEAALLNDGSRQDDLWGINLYPDQYREQFIEYDSMINVRPRQDNRTRGVDSESLRNKIADIVRERIAP